MSFPKLELVSFKLCPYVQRAVITLTEKKVPFTFKEIDLYNPPTWFDAISPLGKVPVLLVNEKTPIFESAVINEYLDEITEPHFISSDPLQRAQERAWIQFGGELFGLFYETYTAKDAETYVPAEKELLETLARLEEVVHGPYFRGTQFSLVDSTYAPLFLRMSLFPRLWKHEAWKQMPKTRKWAESLGNHPSVRASCFEGFDVAIVEWVRSMGAYLLNNNY